jgi:hypothetical protein
MRIHVAYAALASPQVSLRLATLDELTRTMFREGVAKTLENVGRNLRDIGRSISLLSLVVGLMSVSSL